MCLQYQGIDNDDGGVGRVRRARGLNDDDRGIGIGHGIRDASEGLETATEAVGDRRRAQGTYDNNVVVVGGR